MRLVLCVVAALIGLADISASAQLARSPDYQAAFESFQGLSTNERAKLEVMLTAAGYWNAVPVENFSGRVFEAIKQFQTASGFAPTGYLTPSQMERLAQEARLVLNDLGFRSIQHPVRGYSLWVPIGLGLAATRTRDGLSFVDPQNRLKIDYDFYSGISIGKAYAVWMQRLNSAGAQVGYKYTRDDFFVIVAQKNDISWYVRFHQDGPGILGFSVIYNNTNQSIHGFALQTLMSSSMYSAMIPGALTLPAPELLLPASLPPQSQPASPIPSAIAPTPTAPSTGANPSPLPSDSHESSFGTGFFVSAQGHMLTNAHVVDGCSVIQVAGANGPAVARLFAEDSANDLALIKTDIGPSRFAHLRTGVRLGEAVAAFGYPLFGVLSTTGNFTLGNVTSLTGLRDDTRYLQISTPVQPGNSGGPLLDASGNLVGVVAAKLNALKVMLATDGDIPQNVNFAIKGSVAAMFLESNGVSFASDSLGAALAPSDLADYAKAISLPVLCK
jgi:serine protease Do